MKILLFVLAPLYCFSFISCTSSTKNSNNLFTSEWNLKNDSLQLTLNTSTPVFYKTCKSSQFLKKDQTGLNNFSSQPQGHLGYYLEGEFIRPNQSEGCDIISCRPLKSPSTFSLSLIEYIEIEKKAPPASYKYPEDMEKPKIVPVYKLVKYSGDVEAKITYYQDETCMTPYNATFNYHAGKQK